MIIVTSKSFDKKFKKLPEKVRLQAKERILIFKDSSFDVRLNNHMLHGELKMLRSINITGDIRIMYEEIDETTVRFLDIGNHSSLY